MNLPIMTVVVREERDVVLARQRARQVAAVVGFDTQEQTKIATATSEIARNAFNYARGGKVELGLDGHSAPQAFEVRVIDTGPGIADVKHVLSGAYRSSTGMGLGMVGSQRLVDAFNVVSNPAGTTVSMRKILPRHAPLYTARDTARMAATLSQNRPDDALSEVRQQNQELLKAMEELGRRQLELERLNMELEDTNRGVVALYAELDDKSVRLRRADELKGQFLSHMSHEFRTPLNSIIGIARILKARIDGPLTAEQDTQVSLIDVASRELLALVNDLLDLAKVDAGKVEVRPTEFTVDDLFGALRGMMKPLLQGDDVSLLIEDCHPCPPLHTDESKVAQILRNFVSNALKFTRRGHVRMWVSHDPVSPSTVTFRVEDTGLGIAHEHLERIFEDFSQVDNPMQSGVKGTGLGLPLTRKLAALLGGTVTVESTLGKGSTFALIVPVVYANQAAGRVKGAALGSDAEPSAPQPAPRPFTPGDHSREPSR